MLSWIDTLVSWFASFSNTAAIWEYNAGTWVWPLNQLRGFYIALSNIADGMFGGMLDFREWVYNLADDLDYIFSWSSIITWIEDRLYNLQQVVAWFSDWWYEVLDAVNYWWYSVSYTVKEWISIGTQGLAELLVGWNNFVSVILPTLFDFEYAEDWYLSKLAGIGDLIRSAFDERSDLWQGWSDFRQAVSDFTTKPFTWLEDRFTDWFFGGE
jgi:hypothetical protein